MNILPKKRWHVRNKDNVARVRRDEAQAQAEEEERAARRALAEKEARTTLLRDKAHLKFVGGSENKSSSTEVVAVADTQSRHINFFAELESGAQHGANKEYEAEKKAEQEKQEKRIGLLTYLGQSVTESSAPWYSRPSTRTDTEKDDMKSESSKSRLDPLNKVKEYLEIKKKHDKVSSKEKHRTEKHKRHKHKHEEKKDKDAKAKLKALREERIKREEQERRREESLIRLASGQAEVVEESRAQEQSRRYNSQYHPELARKPRDHRYHPY